MRESLGDITKFNILQGGPSAPEMDVRSLPDLPSQRIADRMVETVYIYTQARYCIVDWTRVREWHRQREQICYASKNDEIELQIGGLLPPTPQLYTTLAYCVLWAGAYFIWMIYAIGAVFISNPEHPPKVVKVLLQF